MQEAYFYNIFYFSKIKLHLIYLCLLVAIEGKYLVPLLYISRWKEMQDWNIYGTLSHSHL